MATIGTGTITLTDGDSMTAGEAAEILSELTTYIRSRYQNDDRVTSITPVLTSATITITIT